MSWIQEFFDELYLKTYEPFLTAERSRREAEMIAELLNLSPGEKILDVACGHGRHVIPLAKMGFRVVGVDITPLFIRKAREYASREGVEAEFTVGDARKLNYDNDFDAAYMVFTSFGYYGSRGDYKILASISKALKTSGRFLLDLWNPYRTFSYHADSRDWWFADNILVLEESKYDYLDGYVITRRKYYRGGEEIGRREFKVRVYLPWEIRDMLSRAGFREVSFFGGLDGSKFTIGSRRMVVLAKK